VLRSFFVDDRLASIPAQVEEEEEEEEEEKKKKLVVLRYLLGRCFAEDRPYPEKAVN